MLQINQNDKFWLDWMVLTGCSLVEYSR